MKLGIGKKIILTIGLTVFLLTLFSLVASYFVLINIVRQQTYTHIQSVSLLKENTINGFLDEVISEIEFTNNRKTIKPYLISFLTKENKADKEIILSRIEDLLKYKKYFSDVMVLDKEGMVMVSSNQIDEGKIKSSEPYFVNAKEKTFIQDYFYDVTNGKSVMVVGTPIKDDKENFIGVLVGKINVEGINDLLLQRSGLGDTGESFLVNSNNLVVSELTKLPNVGLKKTIYLPQINSCLQGKSEIFNLLDYNNDKVFGYFHWIPEIESCLVTKIDEIEAMMPVQQVLLTTVFVLFGGGLLMGLFGFLLAKQIVDPIKKLHNSMIKIKGGNFEVQSDIDSNDEVGEMADTFNEMAKELKTSYTSLEDKVKEKTASLEEKVTELSKMNKVMVDRELTMIELKKKLKEKENGNK